MRVGTQPTSEGAHEPVGLGLASSVGTYSTQTTVSHKEREQGTSIPELGPRRYCSLDSTAGASYDSILQYLPLESDSNYRQLDEAESMTATLPASSNQHVRDEHRSSAWPQSSADFSQAANSTARSEAKLNRSGFDRDHEIAFLIRHFSEVVGPW